MLSELALNVMMRMMAGKRYYGEESDDWDEAKRFREMVEETFKLYAGSNFADFLPAPARWFGFGGRDSESNPEFQRNPLRLIIMAKLSTIAAVLCILIPGSTFLCLITTKTEKVVAVICISLLPIESSRDLTLQLFIEIFKVIPPTVLMNIYIAGINQLYDVEIDKVNKPYLPIASGEYSMKKGSVLTLTVLLLSFGSWSISQSPPILVGLVILFIVGTVYSVDLPLLRWKSKPLLAAAVIIIIWALAMPFPFFIHIQKYVLHRPVHLTSSVIFLAAFTFMFVIVITFLKDIPDIEGDAQYGIDNLTVRLGKKKVFGACVNLLLLIYGASCLVFGASTTSFSTMLVTVVAHSSLAFIVWFRAQSVVLDSKVSTRSFYMFVWKLFYVEYVLIQFVR